MSTIDHVWPSGLPKTLWNYEALQQPRNIPFMGYQFSSEFFLALAAGALVIVFFALRRFNNHSSDIGGPSVRALHELNPMDLRAGSLMTQAYVRYVGALLVIYLSLTLFGNLILKAINTLPTVAGLQLDAQNVDFDSPQWPILISFGIAGFVPMLKPIEVIERRLRAWAHESVGIPTRITQQTNRIKRALDGLTQSVNPPQHAPNWLAKIAPLSERDRAFRTCAQLTYLLDWSKDQRAYWPSAKARSVLAKIEREEVQAAIVTLEAFDDLLIENYDHVSELESEARTENRYDLAETPKTEDKRFGNRDQEEFLTYSMVSKDEITRHRRRLEREWNDLTERMSASRDELASMLAIFAEHDRRTNEIANTRMRKVIEAATANEALDEGPTFWLYLSLIPIASIYFFAIGTDHHSLLSNVDETFWSISLSILLNIIKISVLFCIPVSVVMGWRRVLRELDDGSWVDLDYKRLDRPMVRQLLRAAAISLLASVALLALLGLIWAALISHNEDQFANRYLSGNTPFLVFYASQFVVPVASSIVTLLAVEHRRLNPNHSIIPLVPLGILNAFLVLLFWGIHTELWIGFNYCEGVSDSMLSVMRTILLEGPTSTCFRTYDGVDLYVYGILAFCSACLFIPHRDRDTTLLQKPKLANNKSNVIAKLREILGLHVASILLVAAFASISTQRSVAQEATELAKRITIGFRADVEPFAYYDEDEERFRGYLVDLCFRIFEGGLSGTEDGFGPINVVPVRVEASTRFDSFKSPPNGPKIDLLCDPVTLRYGRASEEQQDDGRDGGVFSPIVFTSGVSYLHRRIQSKSGDVVLAWVEGATAEVVARRACVSDLFKINIEKRDYCDTASPVSAKLVGGVPVCPHSEDDLGPDKRYIFCQFASHTAIIRWFCSDPIREFPSSALERAYFGDRDIIIGKLESEIGPSGANQIAESGQCSGYESANTTFTYEPYALVINKSNVELVRFVQRRIYEIFSNRDEIAGIFSANFKGKQMTATLANLFLLNAVEEVP